MELGDPGARFDRDEVATDLSPEQLATAQQKADAWLSEHSDLVEAVN
jgi:hypothetical protein